MIDAGRLRHNINFEIKDLEQDSTTGAVNEVWNTYLANVPAEFVFLSARDLIAAQASQSKVIARVTVRYRSDLESTMRILFKSNYYDIEGILPDPESGLEYFTIPVSRI